MQPETRDKALRSIENECIGGKASSRRKAKRIEAQRLWQRTKFRSGDDPADRLRHGIENYSRHFTGRLPGRLRPRCLIICRMMR